MATTMLEPNLPRMNAEVVGRQVAEVAEALYERTDELATALADAITREVRLYNSTAPVPFELVVHGCATNFGRFSARSPPTPSSTRPPPPIWGSNAHATAFRSPR